MVEVNEGVGGPESCAEFFPGHGFSAAFQQHAKDLEGLILQLDADAAFAQFRFLKINFEDSEANEP